MELCTLGLGEGFITYGDGLPIALRVASCSVSEGGSPPLSDSEAPLLCPVCLVSMGVQLSEECSELGEREETYILNTNLTSRGKKLLKLLPSITINSGQALVSLTFQDLIFW